MIEVGKKYNRWTVLKLDKKLSYGKYFICRCDCGTVKSVFGGSIAKGTSKSCGCYAKELAHLKVDETRNRLRRIYLGMKYRCYKPSNRAYKEYGGRGITVCDEWKNDFQAFYKWAVDNGYRKDLTIDRIDNNGNYEPNNCRWVDVTTQSNNRRNNVLITYKNKTYTRQQFAQLIDCDYFVVRDRLQRGWTPEECAKYAHIDRRLSKLEYKGKYYSLRDIAEMCNLDRRTVWYYLNKKDMSVYDIMEEYSHE